MKVHCHIAESLDLTHRHLGRSKDGKMNKAPNGKANAKIEI